jgi:hypothetical protein
MRLDVRLYDGTAILWPLPEGATWHDARAAIAGLREGYPGVVRRATIVQPAPAGTPVLERLDRTLVGSP